MKNKNLNIEESSSQTDDPKRLQLTGMLMFMDGIFKEISGEISDSLKLLDLGKETEITKRLKKTLENPWQNMSKVNDSFEQSVLSAKEELITAFVRYNKELLESAAFTHDENATHVFLVLKIDDEEIRDVFYSILDKYEENSVLVRYPIILHFASKDMLDEVFEIKYISLDESTHQSV